MTDQERKAMEMALDALEFSQKMGRHYEFDEYHHELAPRALYALRQALEQPDTGIDRGAWDDVPDATKWVDELRGDETEEREPVTWRNAAIRLGEDLYSVGPNGYYNMTASQWLDWALSVVNTAPPKPAQDLIVGYADSHDLNRAGHDFWVSREPGKNTVPLYLYGHPPKIWQVLTDEELDAIAEQLDETTIGWSTHEFARAIEAKSKEKNRG